MELIRVLVVDDSEFVRHLAISVLKDDPEIQIVGECEDGDEVCCFLTSNYVDIVLMDLSMKRMNGDQATILALRNFPTVKVIGYSSHQGQEYRNRMIEVGAVGYVYKSTNLKVVAKIIKSVANPTRIIELPIDTWFDKSYWQSN